MEESPYKRLYRSRKERVLTGLCGGIGEYYCIDPVIVRILTLLLLFSPIGFAAIIIYFLFALIVPKRPL